MNSYLLGKKHGTQEPVRIPKASFDTHWHLIGGTGKGKTTAIHTMLHGLLLDPTHEPCVVIVDRMGNLSYELLLWMASDFCTDEVRNRLVYIQPSREDAVIGFNPLLYDTLAHGYYKVSRASEIILKGWASQNLEEMPRLRFRRLLVENGKQNAKGLGAQRVRLSQRTLSTVPQFAQFPQFWFSYQAFCDKLVTAFPITAAQNG